MDNIPRQNRLPKKERLSGKSDITRMLASGKYGKVQGMRYCFVAENGVPFNRILISVSKKFFKRAVKRNLLKRRIREAYRVSKNLLGIRPDGGVDVFFIYNSKEVMGSEEILLSVQAVLTEISDRQSKRAASSESPR